MLLRTVEIILYCPEHANPQNLEKFRKNSEHKAELFRLAAEMKALIPPNRKLDVNIVTLPSTLQIVNIATSSHEEVNTFIMQHARMQPCKAC